MRQLQSVIIDTTGNRGVILARRDIGKTPTVYVRVNGNNVKSDGWYPASSVHTV